MRKSFVYLLMSAVAFISLGTLNSCKDYEEDLRQESRINLETQAATLGALLDQLKGDCNTRIDSLRDALDACKTLCATERATMNARIDSLATVTANLEAALAAIDLDAKEDTSFIRPLVRALEDRVTTLETQIQNHETRIAALETAQTTILADIATLQTEVARIDGLEARIVALEGKMTTAEGDIAGLKGDVTNLQGDVKDLQDDVKDLQGDMKDAQDDIKDAQNDIKDLQTEIAAIKKDFTDILVEVNKVKADMVALKATLEAQMALLTAKVDGFETRMNDLKDYIDAYQTAQQEYMKNALDQQNTIYKQLLDSQKEYFDNALSVYKDYVDGKYDAIIAAQNALKEALEIKYDALSTKYDALSDKVDDYKALVDALKSAVDGYKGKVDEFIQSYVDNFSKLQNAMSTLQSTITTLSETVGTLSGNLIVTTSKAVEALERAKNDSIMIKNLEDVVESVQAKAKQDSLNTNYRIDTLSSYADKINEALATAQKNYDDAIALLQKRDNVLGDSLFKLDTEVKAIDAAYKAADQLLQDSIDKVAVNVENNKKAIDKIESDLTALTTRVQNLENAHKELVTSIVIQEAVNPVFGTFNLPADVRSTILFGYYGENKLKGTDAAFPSPYSDGFYAWGKDEKYALSDADFIRLNIDDADLYPYGDKKLLLNGEDQLNIGELYVTVNPTKADFSGTEFTLENSNYVEAYAKLSDLEPANKTIRFGYNRAKATGASDNGLYKATASIAKGDVIKAAAHVDGLKTAVKQVIDKVKGVDINVDKKGKITYTNSSELNISELAETILDNISGVTDAYAVKAAWNDDVVGSRAVYSQFGLAATAIPSFTSYKTFQIEKPYKTIPGYELAWHLIDRIAGGIKSAIKDAWPKFDDLKMPTIKYATFTIPEDDGSYSIKYDYDYAINIAIEFPLETGYSIIPGENGYLKIYDDSNNEVGQIPFGEAKYDENGNVVISVYHYTDNIGVHMNYNFYNKMKPVFEAIDEAFGDVNQTYDDLKKLLKDVNKLLTSINDIQNSIDTAADKFASALQSYLKQINSWIVGQVNSANDRLQPIMISTTDKGTRILSFSKEYPREIEASSTFILTNLVGEVLAPAVKKHVACTNVYMGGNDASNSADCMRKLKTFNTQSKEINHVLDGSVNRIQVAGMEKGYVYEIAISCLGYDGYQTTRKHYVTVK